jgi:hypothetical protein
VLPDDWTYDPKPVTKWVMAKKWAANVARLPAPLRALAWRASDVNIAVHFRIGDMQPTKEEWLVAVLNSTILPALAQGALPGTRVVVHVFMRADTDHKMFKLFPRLAGAPVTPVDAPGPRGLPPPPPAGALAPPPPAALDVRVAFHTADQLSPFATFLHLAQADISLQSRSAFSEYAAHVSSRPLSFAADGSRFGARYQQCGVGVVCCAEAVPPPPPSAPPPAPGGNATAEPGVPPLCPYDARVRVLRVLQRRGLLRSGAEPPPERAGVGRSGRLPRGLLPPAAAAAAAAALPPIQLAAGGGDEGGAG